MLERKIENVITAVNRVMEEAGIPSSDQGKDALFNIVENGASFDNRLDKIIQAGRKEGRKLFPIFGK